MTQKDLNKTNLEPLVPRQQTCSTSYAPPLAAPPARAMARWGAALLALTLVRPNAAWNPPVCTTNADCQLDGAGPEDGAVIDGAGISTLIWAGVNVTNATYCAQLNGTKGCMPCAFYALEAPAAAVPAAAADGTYDADDLEAFEGIKQESCYTYNGRLSPIDGVWFDKADASGELVDIRGAGCGQCDARLPEEEQGGTAGTICKLHSDCQENHYCDKVTLKISGTCDVGATTHFADEDLECNEPFDCEIGTDTRSHCLGNSLMCYSCEDEVTDLALKAAAELHCHSMVPAGLKNFMAQTSYPMLVIYLTLVGCTLVYPIWCSVVFFLKNFTRCCGGAKYTWGM